jgi:hypothetical protein
MKNLIATLGTLVLTMTSTLVYSQTDSLYTFEFQLRTSVGGNIALTPVNKAYETDDLIVFQDTSVYWQIIAGTIYFSENWGLDASLFSYTADNAYRLEDRFTQRINETYSEEYFILYNSVDRGNSLEYQEYGSVRGFQAGLSYRYEKNEKFILQPSLKFGVMVFDNINAQIHLKERGTNILKQVDYNDTRSSNNAFSASLGSMIGYKFHQNWIIFAEVYYSYSYAGLEYERKITDLYTGEVDFTIYDHPKHLSSFQFGVGLAVDLKY